MSSVTLTCSVAVDDGSLFTVTSYSWNDAGCYSDSRYTNNNDRLCFPLGQSSQMVMDNVIAHDAGTITCTVTISGSDYTSEPLTLRISGEQLVYCVIACIVYCKQCMLLLLATCYCCIIHQLLWFMYRGVFTVGVAVTMPVTNDNLNSANAIADYSYITASDAPFGNMGIQIARCVTGLGPRSSSENNGDLGGLYFNGIMITNSNTQTCGSDVIQVRPGGSVAGLANIHQCASLTTATEGVYTCTMRNSSMMDQSVRFGLYLSGKSELLDLYILSLNHLSSLYTAPPVIDTPSLSTVTAYVSSSLTLSCTSRGSPPDTFTWRKGNTLLESTTTPVTYNANSAVFRADYSIDSVTTSDSGTYTCTVTNPIGSDSATITVVVIGKFLILLVTVYYKDITVY